VKWMITAWRQRAARLLMVLRARGARSRAVRAMYFTLGNVGWRALALAHLGMSLLRSKAQDTQAVGASGCFDVDYYVARYGRLIPSSMDPLAHFMGIGHRLGYWPNSLFDTAWYLTNATDVAATRLNALAHYVRYGASEGRRPTALFDSAWYLSAYPDVAACGTNPLAHFLHYGWAERRDPSALFSTLFYLSEYTDVAEAGINPLVHYMESGAYEGRDPNPYFSSAWYLSRYPEVALAGRNPLEHYVTEGWRKGYQPGPNFDAERYLDEHPDIARAGIDPLQHFLRNGSAEQRAQPVRRHRVEELMPSTVTAVLPGDVPVVDVIVPVYRGVDETSRCIESVHGATCQTPFRLIVINDCSPEPAMYDYLEEASRCLGFLLLTNAENLGFVGTVNRAMALSDANDVVLLNSDAEVANDWLDRMMVQAYARDRVATVTPLSNNATICSYPDFAGRRKLPAGVTLDRMDKACAAANRGRYVRVPTGVGFCMLIRRAALNVLGLFDAEAFGKGYGEENDFCMRAAEGGWENILALDTFVFHAGEVSFACDSSAGKARGMEVLLSKHPRYLLEVAAHIAEDPARAFRAAITAQLWQGSERPTILMVTHSLGGGTERHVQELAARYAAEAQVLVLRPSGTFSSAGVALQAIGDEHAFLVNVDATDENGLLQLFGAFPISRIHIHHLFGFGPELAAAIGRSKIPFEFTVHDYFAVCPQINLTRDAVHYCGEPAEAGCNACILANPRMDARDIRSWRHRHSWVLRDAARVVTPSIDTLRRIRRYAPDANVLAIRHESVPERWHAASPTRQLAAASVMRVAILGVLAPHKGRALVIEAAMYARAQGLPLEFVVIGDPAGELPPPVVAAIRSSGRYKESELQRLLTSEQPDLVLFASQWPETYSYTLSAAFEAGLPVLVPDVGAFSERIHGRPWSFVFDAAINGKALAERLVDLRARHFVTGVDAAEATVTSVDGDAVVEPATGYALTTNLCRPVPPVAPPRVLAILESQGDVPSPCAHIRLVPFLDAMQAEGHISVRYITAAEVDLHEADVLVTHRVPVATLAEANALCDHAHRLGIPLVYDLDDNLYDLNPRAEGGKYQPLLDIVHTFVDRADEIWASTPVLAQRLREVGARDVQVQRNQLDPALWRPALGALRESARGNAVRIVYMGTRTHDEDFALIEPALRALKKRYGAAIDIMLVGVRANDDDEGYLNSLAPSAVVGASYPAFVTWMAQQPPFDIGLSPLRASAFNRCKSEIKVLDYAALGAVPVVSDIAPYHDTVRDGVDGFLVPDDPDRWFDVLDRLVGDPASRRRVASAAHARDMAGEFAAGVAARLCSLESLIRVPGIEGESL